jgi:hypothetical protein
MKSTINIRRGEGILRNEAPRPKGRSFPVRGFLYIVPLPACRQAGTSPFPLRRDGALAGQKGIVLPIALIFLVILSIMGIAAIMTSTSTTAVFGGLRRADEALYYAEAGVEAAKRVIAQTSPNFDQVYANSGQLTGLEGTISYNDGKGSYTVVLLNNEDDPGYPGPGHTTNVEKDGRYIIHSKGVAGDASKTIEVVVESFSRFFYFTEWEEAPGQQTQTDIFLKYVFFRTNDSMIYVMGGPDPRMDGPVHSNHALHISGSPTFSALTSSNESPYYLAGSASEASIFRGGTNWNRYVTLPVGPDKVFGTDDDLTDVKNGATSVGRIIDTYDTPTSSPWEYRVHFRGDRGMEADIYKKNPSSGNWTFVETLEIGSGFNGVIYFHGGGPIHVGGKIQDGGSASQIGKLDPTGGTESTVQGRWTICSAKESTDVINPPGEIRIVGDIKYGGSYTGGNPFPTVGTDPTGLLGLVSANNVVIKEDGEDTAQTIRNNGVTIHASIMATSNDNATFSVETALLEAVSGSLGRQINLLGGIIQYRRGVVGKFTAAGLTQGFQKNYRYDTRLLYMTPPAFPLAVSLKIKSWKE